MAEPPLREGTSAGMQSMSRPSPPMQSALKRPPSKQGATGSSMNNAGSKSPFIFPSSASSPYIMLPNSTKPFIQFSGDILIVTEAWQAEDAVSALMDSGAAKYGVGFDMEWQPVWNKNQPKSPTALIQVATEKVCVLFWMRHLKRKMPLPLKNLLLDDSIRKVGLSMDQDDAKRLRDEFGVTMRNVVDVSERAKRYGLAKGGMKHLVDRLLGTGLNKAAQVSSWGAASLTMQQIYYAATDAYVTLLLFYKIEVARAAQHQLIEDPNEAYFCDDIVELYLLSQGHPPVHQATNLGAHLPLVETLPDGRRVLLFKDGKKVEQKLRLPVIPARQVKPHAKNIFVDRYGQVTKKESPGQVGTKPAVVRPAKPTGSESSSAPAPGPSTLPTSQTQHNANKPPSVSSAVSGPAPAPTPSEKIPLNQPASPAAPIMITIPMAEYAAMNQEVAFLKQELAVAHQSIQQLIIQLDLERRRAALAAMAPSFPPPSALHAPVIARVHPAADQAAVPLVYAIPADSSTSHAPGHSASRPQNPTKKHNHPPPSTKKVANAAPKNRSKNPAHPKKSSYPNRPAQSTAQTNQ